MYILVDVKRMLIVHRCEKVETVRALANIEFVHSSTGIFEETNKAAYSRFSVGNLQELFKGLLAGVEPFSNDPVYITNQIIRLCQSALPSKVDAFEATVQSLQLGVKDTGFYRYQLGASKPRRLTEPYEHPPLLGNWEAAQALPLTAAPNAAPVPTQAAPQAIVAPVAAPKYPPPWA